MTVEQKRLLELIQIGTFNEQHVPNPLLNCNCNNFIAITSL